jgi:ABC-type anion transport system duplicated permease subunit
VIGILLPAAFPYILSGVKIGWVFAWRTIIAVEMVFGVPGLLVEHLFFRWLERRTVLRWGMTGTH